MHGLLRIVAVMALPLLGALSHAEEATQQQCQLKQLASVDLALVGGLVLIPVTINDVPVQMALHIGAAFGSVSARAIDSLNIKKRSWPSNLAQVRSGSETIDALASADSIVIGRLSFRGAEFLVSNTFDARAGSDSMPVVGTLGMNFFEKVDLELDFAKRKLNLYSHEHCPGKVVYWADSFATVPMRKGRLGEVYFLMELEGKTIQTSLYTGTATTILYTDASKALFDFDEKSPGIVTETDDSGRTSSHYRAMALTAEGLGIMNTKIGLMARNKSCGTISKKIGTDGAAGYKNCYGDYPLRLGLNVIQKLHIYIATKEQKMYFTAADAS